MNREQFDGWVPIDIYASGSRPLVEWCFVGNRRFTEPFFSKTIEDCIQHPFNLLFRHQTPIETLREWSELQPGLDPSGFIFHSSRCGSTLISQMLAELPRNVVISEARPIDAVLRAHLRDKSITDPKRIEWLRWLVSAIGQKRSGVEEHLFIKFDSWNVVELKLIKQAFPAVPWVFVYREPFDVLVSHLTRYRGLHMIPGAIDPELFALDSNQVTQIEPEEYCAQVLGQIYRAGAEGSDQTNGLLVHYHELPGAVTSRIAEHFRLNLTERECDRLAARSQFDAKNPTIRFVNEAATTNRRVSDQVRVMAERWVVPWYEQLQARRMGRLGNQLHFE